MDSIDSMRLAVTMAEEVRNLLSGVARAMHALRTDALRAQGCCSQTDEYGDVMVPWEDLSEPAQQAYRDRARDALNALTVAGYLISKPQRSETTEEVTS